MYKETSFTPQKSKGKHVRNTNEKHWKKRKDQSLFSPPSNHLKSPTPHSSVDCQLLSISSKTFWATSKLSGSKDPSDLSRLRRHQVLRGGNIYLDHPRPSNRCCLEAGFLKTHQKEPLGGCWFIPLRWSPTDEAFF